MKKFFTKRNIYIMLFAILYSVVALVSLIHSFSFFGLANNTGMSVMLGTAFEIGQAAVLFAILTSSQDRKRIMPWALMILFTTVQIIGNVFSSYKYLMQHGTADMQYFKDPIFIWTDIPDAQATVIITYLVGAILPICCLCLTAMITNYLEDNKSSKHADLDDDKKSKQETIEEPVEEIIEEPEENEIDKSELPENIDESEEEIHEDEPDEINDSHFINI